MAVHYNPRVVYDGLVLYLDAANRNSLPTSSSIWYDLTPNGYQCSLSGGTKYDNYISFSTGNHGIITQSSSPLWSISNNFTTQAMFSEHQSSTNYAFIYGFNDVGSSWLNLFHNSPSRRYFNDDPTITDTVDLYNSGWHLYTLVVNGGSASIYRNDILVAGPTAGSWITPSGSFRIALDNALSYPNIIDFSFISVYNRALSASEIVQNFNALRGRFQI